jgi:hypothetical protein
LSILIWCVVEDECASEGEYTKYGDEAPVCIVGIILNPRVDILMNEEVGNEDGASLDEREDAECWLNCKVKLRSKS